MQKYLSLIKFSHTIFALPFAVVGFILGMLSIHAEFDFWLFLKVLACMVFARSAAMAFNRYLDRHIDKMNPRTQGREIPSGILSEKNVLVFTVVNCLFFIAVTYFINPLCFMLSPVALFVILGYSYTKRFTSYCHIVLGVGLALAPVGAYLAVTGAFHILPVFLGISVLSWVGGFDIIYALQDDVFDAQNGLHSIPARFGRVKAIHIAQSLHLISAVFLIWFVHKNTVYFPGFEWIVWIGALFFMGMLVYQHTIISAGNLSKVGMAFFTFNGLASILFSAFFVLDAIFI